MVKFTHYLVTRFNVPVTNWNTDKAGQPVLDGTWMQHRLALFKRYCVPTIVAQSEKNFLWIIYCSDKTPPADSHQIEEAINKVPGATIRIVAHFEEMMSDLRQFVSNAPTPYVITSRVDNDDGLGINYIKTIQEHFKETDKLLLNPEGGIIYDIHEKVLTQMKNSLLNHYSSLIEMNQHAEELLTVFGFHHLNPPDSVHIENIPGKRYWLKIIHERNVKSRLKGRPFFKRNTVLFEGINNSEFSISYINTIMYVIKKLFSK